MIPIVLVSIAIHEFAHCWTTDRLGDDTPRLNGRVTLNPLVHLDPLGTVMIVITAMAGFGIGWGRPSPFNPANFRHPARDRMLTAIAGPLSNFAQLLAWASLGLLVSRLPALAALLGGDIFDDICLFGIWINASLGLFNLLPIYPLDGHHVLSFFAPSSLRPLIDNPMWQFVLIAIIFVPSLRGLLHTYLMTGAGWMFSFTYLVVGWLPPKLLS
ncbi:MAG: site-2 protease family protein [Armatimonadota bacterium]